MLSGTGAAQDADALVALASWCLSGDHIRRDLGEARRLFGRAASLGHAGAETVYTAMLANGSGSQRRWCTALRRLARRAQTDAAAAKEIALIKAMDLDPDGDPKRFAHGASIGTSPDVTAYRGFLTAAECRYLIHVATPRLQPSVVMDSASGRVIIDPVRRSAAAAFPFVLEAPAVHAINRRIARATATLAEQGEPLQILRYRPGEEYRPHYDALARTQNQRVLTFLIYLNEDYDGGETLFLTSGLKVRGRTGDAISFRNVTDSGASDPGSRHAGLTVTHGQKFLLSRWIRARPLNLLGEPGRPY